MRQQLAEQDSLDEQKHFNYSVAYFTWALSDSEEDEEDECQSITLPLSKLMIANKKEANSKNEKKDSKS